MQIAQSHKPFNRVDYYVLGNGYADVFMHKNETQENDEEGNIIYKAEEVYYQIEDNVTKEVIEENFDFMWEDVGKEYVPEPTEVKMLRDYVLDLDMRVIMMEFGL